MIPIGSLHSVVNCLKTLGSFIHQTPGENPPFLMNPQLLLQAKTLVCSAVSTPLSLTKWEETLHILPMNADEHKALFCDMLVCCKIMKFWEVNYKILSCILATPVILSAVHKNLALARCYWCGEQVNIDHILLYCDYTKTLHSFVSQHLGEVSLES